MSKDATFQIQDIPNYCNIKFYYYDGTLPRFFYMFKDELEKRMGNGDFIESNESQFQPNMKESTFTDKYNDDPKLKGGQKDLPDALQAKIVAKEGYDEFDMEDEGPDYNSVSDLEDELRRLIRWSNQYGSKGADSKIEQLKKRIEDLKKSSVNEGEDHEVSMAQNSLEAIISAASQLMGKLGDNERNIPGWIQNHITNAENYIEQANQGFHELESNDDQDELNEDMFSNNDSKVKLVDLRDKIGAGPFTNRILDLNINILDQVWDDINKVGMMNENLDMNQTQVLSKEVAKALVLALNAENQELSSLKIKNLEPNSFEIYVTYKDNADDEFSFYVDGDKLKLSDFSFTEILGTVDKNGNIDRNKVKNNLLKTWAKHIKKDEN
jgi:hypothetical protein